MIRETTLKGDPYLVAPAVLAVECVSTKAILVPFRTLTNSAPAWNNRPVTIGHPEGADGTNLSATSPEAIDEYEIGRVLAVQADANHRRLLAELWINLADVERLGAETDSGALAREVVESLRDGGTVGVSPGHLSSFSPEEGQFQGMPYVQTVEFIRPDHAAVLVGGSAWGGEAGAIDAEVPETPGELAAAGDLATLHDEQAGAETPAGDHFAAARNEAIAKLRSDDTAGFQLATINDDETVGAKIATRELPVDGSVGSLNMLLAATFQVASKYDRSVEDILGRVADYHDLAETEIHRNTAGSDA